MKHIKMKPLIYIFMSTEKLNFAKMSVTTLLHSHDDLCLSWLASSQVRTIGRIHKT